MFKAFNRFGIDSLSRCIDTRSRGNRCVRRHIKGTRRVRRRRKSSRRRRKSPLLPISHPSSVEEHANVCKCMQIRVCGRASPPPSRHPFSSKRNPQIKEMQTIHCFHYCCHRYCYIFGWGLLSAIPPTPSPSPLLPDFAISDARRTLKRPSIVLLERFAALPAATEKCGLYEAWEVYRRRRRRRRRRCGRGRKCLGVRRVRGGGGGGGGRHRNR